MRAIGIALLLALALPARGAEIAQLPLSVELHAHLFMKEGMGWAFAGDFFGPLQAHDWKDQFRSMTNPETLNASGIGIVVAALYANPLFCFSLKHSIREQIELAHKFLAENPDWVLGRSAQQARQALATGRRVLILSLEGASGILESEKDLSEFIDQGGIRIVNLLHLTDDEFGGVAFLPGAHVLSSPWAWFKSLFGGSRDALGVKVNSNGLTDRGRKAAQALLNHGVWLDLAHASDESYRELAKMLKDRGHPHLYTHTVFRRYMGAERGITDAQVDAIKESKGFLGTMPAETMLTGTPIKKQPPCDSAFEQLVVQYTEFAAKIGAESVALGSDYNGGVRHLQPTCATGTSLDASGLWNIGQQAEVWKALEKAGAPVPKPLGKTIERFLDAWARVK